MRVLVAGGAGYIGSHVAALLAERGHTPIIFDNLSQGHLQAAAGHQLIIGDIHDRDAVRQALADHRIEAVMHFAARIQVGESVSLPLDYYQANVAGSISLLQAMQAEGVSTLVFSSTAAVYGTPQIVPIVEGATIAPENPYGATKATVEEAMGWAGRAGQLRYVALRYFNAAGAHPDQALGEDHAPETHLIPLVLQVALGQREAIAVFGNDYDTPDGTCLRDYVHVMDLAAAHLNALDYLAGGGESTACNLGNGQGYSVRQVIEIARTITGHPIPARDEPRRPGDPARLVASSQRARDLLGWRPARPELETIIADAWRWHREHPTGYR